MDFADLWVIFDAEVDTRAKTVHQRRAQRCTIDLTRKQANSGGEFFRVIGCPPDSLAFARSNGSGGHERGVPGF